MRFWYKTVVAVKIALAIIDTAHRMNNISQEVTRPVFFDSESSVTDVKTLRNLLMPR